MKRLLAALLLAIGLNGNTSAETITITTGEYPPWTSQSLKYGGYVNRVISEAFKRQGITVKYLYFPWKRAIETARSGEHAATSFWFYSKDREADFIHSEPVMNMKTVFFHLRTTPIPENWSSLEEFQGFRIGATRGYTYTKAFWDMAKTGKLKVDVVTDDEQNMRKLLAGRIQAFPIDELTGWDLLNRKFAPAQRDLLTTTRRPLVTGNGYLLISRKYPNATQLANKFNLGLKQLHDEGLIERYQDDLISGKY